MEGASRDVDPGIFQSFQTALLNSRWGDPHRPGLGWLALLSPDNSQEAGSRSFAEIRAEERNSPAPGINYCHPNCDYCYRNPWNNSPCVHSSILRAWKNGGQVMRTQVIIMAVIVISTPGGFRSGAQAFSGRGFAGQPSGQFRPTPTQQFHPQFRPTPKFRPTPRQQFRPQFRPTPEQQFNRQFPLTPEQQFNRQFPLTPEQQFNRQFPLTPQQQFNRRFPLTPQQQFNRQFSPTPEQQFNRQSPQIPGRQFRR
jgi:hypothetical protein